MKSGIGYIRISSQTNVDGDSIERQKTAIESYAKKNKLSIVCYFEDLAVSGADPLDQRKGFVELLQYMNSNGAKIILVENASRFARDLAVQISGYELLKKKNYELIQVDSPSHFKEDTPTATMVQNILGAVAEFEKTNMVEKLKVPRERMIEEQGKCEGGKSVIEMNPEVKELVKKLRKKPRGRKQLSLRKVSEELFKQGYKTTKNKPLSSSQILRISTF
tara:strand:- start:57 stop:716 length:660 start_codon:yes stop_codon:yes gene_type:complete